MPRERPEWVDSSRPKSALWLCAKRLPRYPSRAIGTTAISCRANLSPERPACARPEGTGRATHELGYEGGLLGPPSRSSSRFFLLQLDGLAVLAVLVVLVEYGTLLRDLDGRLRDHKRGRQPSVPRHPLGGGSGKVALLHLGAIVGGSLAQHLLRLEAV